jgi:peptide/nickel transport system permease protein
MSAIEPIEGTLPAALPSVGTRRGRRNGKAIVGAAIIGALVLAAILAPLIAPDNPDAIQSDKVLAGPSPGHPLGFDSLGRDMLSRLLFAYRTSLIVAGGSVLLGLLVGGLIGLIAGYRRGWFDTVLMRPVDMLLAFPALLLAITLVSITGASTFVVVVAIAIIYLPLFARVMRSSVLAVSTLPYVDASRCRGASHLRAMTRHVLPNASGPVIVQASILAGFAVQIEAALSFLGLGAQPPTPSLGQMLSEGREFLQQAPHVEIYPGIAIALAVLGFLLLGDGLRSHLDPRRIT